MKSTQRARFSGTSPPDTLLIMHKEWTPQKPAWVRPPAFDREANNGMWDGGTLSCSWLTQWVLYGVRLSTWKQPIFFLIKSISQHWIQYKEYCSRDRGHSFLVGLLPGMCKAPNLFPSIVRTITTGTTNKKKWSHQPLVYLPPQRRSFSSAWEAN